MDPDLLDRIGALLGRRITACRPALGGYTAAERWICTLEDGQSAFAKVAVDTRTAQWLREEYHVYQYFDAVYMPRFLGWSDDHSDRPILLLEDLSHADWPPPWTQPRIERVLALISAVAATPAPLDLPRLADQKESVFSGWATVARDPRAFLSLGLCSATWLERSLERLVQVEAEADVSGESFLHLDVRSDNLCFDGPRTLLVDWNLAAIGNPRIELIGWLPSLSAEGGPPLDQLTGPDDAPLAVITAGHFAARAGLPPSSPTSRARISQLMQLKPSLPWACRPVGLDLPDPVAP
jgi:hypothetical protein